MAAAPRGCPFGHGASSAPSNEQELSDFVNSELSSICPVANEGCYYGTYLGLDKLLTAQHPVSAEHGEEAHDEMLFIIVHQVYELWFKQILHEIDSIIGLFAQERLAERDLGLVVNRLQRVDEIQRILINQISVLETMHPLDFLDFRRFLTPASGFQSFQFRILENKLGMQRHLRFQLQKTEYLGYFKREHQEMLVKSETWSLLSLVEKWLERTPALEMEGWTFISEYRKAVDQMLQEDRDIVNHDLHSSPEQKAAQLGIIDQTKEQFESIFDEAKHQALVDQGVRRISFKALQAALMISLYRDEPLLHLPFKCLTLLLQMDENISLWRYRHTMMVHRMLGSKIGTGGSAGYSYLKSTTSDRYKIFIDFYNLSSFLIPRSSLPDLPAEARAKLGFYTASAAATLAQAAESSSSTI